MKKLTDDIKRALNALAYQHVADYLPMGDKKKILGKGDQNNRNHRGKNQSVVPRQQVRKIAFLYDGQINNATLEFAIDAVKRQGQSAQLDLLLYGKQNQDQLELQQKWIHDAGVEFQQIELCSPILDSIINYTTNQGALISLVSHPDDPVARKLIEQVLPLGRNSLYVPIILVGEGPSRDFNKKSAA